MYINLLFTLVRRIKIKNILIKHQKIAIIASLIIVLVVGFSCGFSLGKAGTVKKSTYQNLRNKYDELLQDQENSESKSTSSSSTKPSEQEIVLNQPFTVNTENGSYSVTITGTEIKDWRERSGGDITNLNLLLKYTVENIDYSNSYSSGCYVDSNLFYIYDDDKTWLDTATWSYEVEGPGTVLPGYKGQFELCYDLKKEDTKYIDVVVHNNELLDKDTILGQIRIDLQ